MELTSERLGHIRDLRRSGKVGEALAAADKLLKQMPEDRSVLMLHAELTVFHRFPADALRVTAKLVKMFPSSAKAQYLLARAEFGSRRYSEALVAVNESDRLAPNDSRTTYLRVKTLKRLGRLGEVVCPKFDENSNPSSCDLQVLTFCHTPSSDEELDRIMDALAKEKTYTPERLLLTRVAFEMRRGNLTKAVDLVTDELLRTPDSSLLRVYLSKSKWDSGDIPGAIALMEDQFNRTPFDVNVFNELCLMYRINRQWIKLLLVSGRFAKKMYPIR